ncbi:lipocalin-like domain-containing protein [[Eubacterium] cellulosolvens]
MIKDQLIGTWRLNSAFSIRQSDGEVLYPFSKQPVGQITYDSAGNMSVIIMRPERPKSSINDKSKATNEEIKSAFNGFEAYFGTYEIDEEQKVVSHHIVGSLFPNWEGMTQTRFAEFSGNQLTLKTPPMPYGGETITGTLVWQRKS